MSTDTVWLVIFGLPLAPFVVGVAWFIFLAVARLVVEVCVYIVQAVAWVLKIVFWS